MLQATLSSMNEHTDTMTFTLDNVDKSIANSLRRIILSDIDVYCFDTTGDNAAKVVIQNNTSRFNNEILKQRLCCIPVHINDDDFPYENYEMFLEEKNDTQDIKFITTEHFKIKDIVNDKIIDDSRVKQFFPINKQTQGYILFARLRPSIGDVPGEMLKLSCSFSKSNAKKNGAFNTVSTCAYGETIDSEKSLKIWNDKEKEYRTQKKTDEEILHYKDDFMNLETQRYTKKNSYDFTIETIGIYKNTEIVKKACNIMNDHLNFIQKTISEDELEIRSSDIINENAYDIKLKNESYTVGKVIEYALYSNLFENKETLSFCGFKQFHPHDDYSIIRLIYKDEVKDSNIKDDIMQACNDLKKIYNDINELF
jgi:DNA-directed RNA polymerase subunit L